MTRDLARRLDTALLVSGSDVVRIWLTPYDYGALMSHLFPPPAPQRVWFRGIPVTRDDYRQPTRVVRSDGSVILL